METSQPINQWLRDGKLVYILHETGKYRKGEPIVSNKFCLSVYPDYAHGITDQDAEKVAKKMAAADDLLEACVKLVSEADTEGLTEDTLNKIEAAIKKATE